MPRPLDIPTIDQRHNHTQRRTTRLERRSAGPWHYVGNAAGAITGIPDPLSPDFQNGWTNAGSGLQAARFRWLLGGGVEVQGSLTGGAYGTIAFTLPAGFTPDIADHGTSNDGEVRLPACDDAGNFVVLRVAANGDVTVHFA